ncbi:MAG TPA: hypothetical protein VG099_19515 [Gemmataceae bacterium]|jgi:hypothetical protein|nr:hypothetical protein [Gemmataceae bacterium]
MELMKPEWLSKRDGDVRPGTFGNAWLVLLAGEPQYRLVPVPADGKYSCQVIQTVNGKRLDKGGVFASPDEACRGGLEDLRQALGW